MAIENIGTNIQIEVTKDGKDVITIDLAHRGNLSSSGKSIIVASTGGNVPIPGSQVIIGLNAYIKKDRYE